MPEKIEELVRKAVADAQEAGDLPSFEVGDLGLERPADADNGDWTTTLALRSARLAHMAPRAIAQAIVNHMEKDPGISKVEVAGPGFVNFYLSAAANNEVFRTVREQGHDFGRSNIGAGEKVQVEFVSANPVGPLHIGHGRWAALGDSLCRVMEHAGYNVEREYYINDHGSQMDVFGNSVAERYLQLAQVVSERGCSLDEAVQVLLDDRKAFVKDEEDAHPELHPYMDAFNKNLGGNAYGGDYIIDVARHFMETDGTRWVDSDPEERMLEFRERGYKLMLESIKSTLDESRCHFDVWFSERSLYEKGEDGTSAVDRALARLDEMGYLYRDEDGALWFRSTALGDDKDRVLIKTNGEYTYFASDVAYHWNKFQRVDHVIDIWGADHHGYIQRVDSACTALGYPGKLEVLLGQLVNLLRDGVPVRMSKRKGTMIPFKELMDEVGVDATRYTLISKSSNQMIDFDIEKVKKQDNTNPVYYVQYAHARICSILRKGAGVTAEEAEKLGMDEVARRAVGEEYDLSLLTDPTEATLARKLSEFPALVEGCARDRAPFRLTHYAEELAGDFHSFYTVCQVLPSKGRPVDEGLSKARLAAVDATRRVLALTLEFCGVHAPQSM
ncbi:arginine--tRNA ligase [Olsenella sp. TM06-36]|jgi:arginyl-tRNA synthetase|uniref:arginine--tRNA ligase n=1 Tax=Atopobiaceae TaxID=1643824 RepID=UPI000509CBFB|nr:MULTISPECIES: arginine--tRNA ligase [unclassified Olsenella]RGJ46567.1 arginine--tRNA ligase [Olsenella sp. TM06-36]RGS51643.1 arginine--tRNA ligase [Olsenella sp. AF21-51]RHJ93800.1 arginine--tRNA ligase [Olsenella sp. AM05-7]RHJ99563.1 arginine--tRNA ligase [Olsenella sp. AM05-17]